MIACDEPTTWLRGAKPRRPIECSLCGALIGAWWQYKTTHYAYMHPCSHVCERLIDFSRGRRGVPRQWREFPREWRAPLLAAGMAERSADETA